MNSDVLCDRDEAAPSLLPCPVRAEVAEDLALQRLKVEVVESGSVTADLRQADGLDRRSAHLDNLAPHAVPPLVAGGRSLHGVRRMLG
jgi:hypothetical protein